MNEIFAERSLQFKIANFDYFVIWLFKLWNIKLEIS